MSDRLYDEYRSTRERYTQCCDRVSELIAVIKSSSEWENAPQYFVHLVENEQPFNSRAFSDARDIFGSSWSSEKKKISALGSIKYWVERAEKYENNLRAAFGQLREEYRANAELLAAGGELFFRGCDTREKLDKRYKALAKVFHPDSETGDMETMQIINAEYERQKEDMSEDADT